MRSRDRSAPAVLTHSCVVAVGGGDVMAERAGGQAGAGAQHKSNIGRNSVIITNYFCQTLPEVGPVLPVRHLHLLRAVHLLLLLLLLLSLPHSKLWTSFLQDLGCCYRSV